MCKEGSEDKRGARDIRRGCRSEPERQAIQSSSLCSKVLLGGPASGGLDLTLSPKCSNNLNQQP